jgi:hypothetical protein
MPEGPAGHDCNAAIGHDGLPLLYQPVFAASLVRPTWHEINPHKS